MIRRIAGERQRRGGAEQAKKRVGVSRHPTFLTSDQPGGRRLESAPVRTDKVPEWETIALSYVSRVEPSSVAALPALLRPPR